MDYFSKGIIKSYLGIIRSALKVGDKDTAKNYIKLIRFEMEADKTRELTRTLVIKHAA